MMISKETMQTEKWVTTITEQYRVATLELVKFLLYLGIVVVYIHPQRHVSLDLGFGRGVF